MPAQDEPASPFGRDVLVCLRGGPAEGRTNVEIARMLGILPEDCRRIVHALVIEGWVTDNGRRGSARRLVVVTPHEPKETNWGTYPGSVTRVGCPTLHPDGPPPKVLAPVREADASATKALTAWLVEEVKRDPLAVALALASTEALVQELTRRQATMNPLVAAGLPPAE